METLTPQEITRLLADWNGGDPSALERLAPLVYAELRRIARRQMQGETGVQTLGATALVNEAFARLAGDEGADFRDRAHFYAVCAQVMRRVLVEHARAPADESALLAGAGASELVALDEALGALEALDPRKARVVELRYFAGLSVEETAEVLGVPAATVGREWRRAKAWLYRALAGEASAS